MPTGYTAGIIDGTTKTFEDFAKDCMRAFGTTIHMRDEDMGIEYQKRIPGDYHKKEIKKAKSILKNKKSNEVIIQERRVDLLKSKSYHEEALDKCIAGQIKLNEFLIKAESFTPPTSEHVGIKDFMIDQIKQTISFDNNADYHKEELAKINLELENMDPDKIRQNLERVANKDLIYHSEELKKEVKRCNESNKWVEDFLNSLK
jgi:hypothetical protein